MVCLFIKNSNYTFIHDDKQWYILLNTAAELDAFSSELDAFSSYEYIQIVSF